MRGDRRLDDGGSRHPLLGCVIGEPEGDVRREPNRMASAHWGSQTHSVGGIECGLARDAGLTLHRTKPLRVRRRVRLPKARTRSPACWVRARSLRALAVRARGGCPNSPDLRPEKTAPGQRRQPTRRRLAAPDARVALRYQSLRVWAAAGCAPVAPGPRSTAPSWRGSAGIRRRARARRLAGAASPRPGSARPARSPGGRPSDAQARGSPAGGAGVFVSR